MKKLFALLMSVLLLLGVFAGCGEGGEKETTAAPVEHSLSVGFGRADITPTEPTPLGGLGDTLNRFHTEVLDELNCDCIVITDETDTSLMLISIDSRSVSPAMLMGANRIARKTGIPYENIIVATTHSHSAPDPYTNHYSIENYSAMLQDKMMEAAEAALADRKPAAMATNTVYPEKINFIRHYVMSDGTYAGDGFGSTTGKTIVGHTSEVDNGLQLVKFTREGAKDIIMMNWQGHPTGHSGNDKYKVLSYPGSVTDAVEAGLDCHCMYVLGASGDVNNNSRISEEKLYSHYKDRAKALAQYVIDAESTYQEAAVGKVQVAASSIACTSKGNAAAEIAIDAYAIGDVALIAAPYEMFNENGLAIKAASPFKMTFVSTCTNGRVTNYIPAASTYAYNNKPDEVYEIKSGAYAQGTAELLQTGFVDLLKQLNETR